MKLISHSSLQHPFCFLSIHINRIFFFLLFSFNFIHKLRLYFASRSIFIYISFAYPSIIFFLSSSCRQNLNVLFHNSVYKPKLHLSLSVSHQELLISFIHLFLFFSWFIFSLFLPLSSISALSIFFLLSISSFFTLSLLFYPCFFLSFFLSILDLFSFLFPLLSLFYCFPICILSFSPISVYSSLVIINFLFLSLLSVFSLSLPLLLFIYLISFFHLFLSFSFFSISSS